ncbi:MAG: tetratricopeptide repeat protein [Chthoniobacterales bacterium]
MPGAGARSGRDGGAFAAGVERSAQGSAERREYLFSIGLVERRQGKLDESIEFLRRATISDPRNQDIWSNLGRSYRGKRDSAAAREMFDRAFAISPDEMQFMGAKPRPTWRKASWTQPTKSCGKRRRSTSMGWSVRG